VPTLRASRLNGRLWIINLGLVVHFAINLGSVCFHFVVVFGGLFWLNFLQKNGT